MSPQLFTQFVGDLADVRSDLARAFARREHPWAESRKPRRELVRELLFTARALKTVVAS